MHLTSEEDVQAKNPFLPGNQPIVECVKVLEDPVHQDVVCHLEDVVEELPEGVPVHPVNLFSVMAVQLEQDLDKNKMQIQKSKTSISESEKCVFLTNAEHIFFSCFFVNKLTFNFKSCPKGCGCLLFIQNVKFHLSAHIHCQALAPKIQNKGEALTSIMVPRIIIKINKSRLVKLPSVCEEVKDCSATRL